MGESFEQISYQLYSSGSERSVKALLVKFGYIGWLYSGFQKGNGNASIEGSILSVIQKNGISDGIASAARTDRDVSATGNVFKVKTDEKPEKVLGILNHEIRGMIFHGWSIATETTNPRHCDSKTYRYVMRNDLISGHKDIFKTVMLRFTGTHDFSNFSRRDVRNPLRTVNSISFQENRDTMYIDINAKSFLWNQIRTMIAYALWCASTGDARDPFSLESRFPGVAEAVPLVLLDIFYTGISFNSFLSRSKIDSFTRLIDRSAMETRILEQFSSVIKQIT